MQSSFCSSQEQSDSAKIQSENNTISLGTYFQQCVHNFRQTITKATCSKVTYSIKVGEQQYPQLTATKVNLARNLTEIWRLDFAKKAFFESYFGTIQIKSEAFKPICYRVNCNLKEAILPRRSGKYRNSAFICKVYQGRKYR